MVNFAVVVLGAATTKEAKPSPTLLRRTRSGCDLVKGQADARLLVCGGQTNSHHFVREASVMAEIAREEGLPDDMIIEEGQSRNTLENAIFTKRIMAEQGWTHVRVVTDPVHLPRARMVFAALGIKAQFHRAHAQPKAGWRQLIAAGYEVPALLWYAIRILSGHHKQYLKKLSS